MKIKHIVITRFSNDLRRNMTIEKLLDEERLRNRLELFKYTVKSLEEQTNKNFEHYVLIHPDIPKSVLDDLLKLNIKTIYNTSTIKEMDFSDYDFLITTRIDDDDALYNGAIQDIQTCFNENTKLKVFGYLNGCTYHTNIKKFYPFNNTYRGEGMLALGMSMIVNLKYFKDKVMIIHSFNHSKMKKPLFNYLKTNYKELNIEYNSTDFWEHRKTSFPAFIYFIHNLGSSKDKKGWNDKVFMKGKELLNIKNFPELI